ncbi:transglycosylase SLT domain-containing protein [Ostreibacterium oceani]|uniref:Transglycosylase SLT domain-containing protein n=1 Tax=Ostreibacterium oceani TaxID=2654998 RepID=A0A6N7EW93_9GAMM|nr:transglycosylase SLT domain-containing protein [Ostreibacterium oceani]MPV85367.1 transglycosylase SLT domain-containing protein [Ostreibacterium oceani]
MKIQITHTQKLIFLFLVSLLGGCSSIPKQAESLDNACSILDTHKKWRSAFDQTFKKYGVPPHVVMAFMHQESRFVHDARPPKKKILGIPTQRPSTAYGYAQALDSTWDWYRDKTGYRGAKRDHLPDAVDFVGWYINENHRRTGISKWDAANQYFAYHDGTTGFLKGTHKEKAWLLNVAQKVNTRASMYRRQLAACYKYPAL